VSNRDCAEKHPSKPRRKRRDGPRKSAAETTLAIIDRLLLSKMRIRLNGEERKITALEAITLRLLQKAVAGDLRASRVLLKYEELARPRTEAPLQIAFVESGYTQSLAAPAPEAGHG